MALSMRWRFRIAYGVCVSIAVVAGTAWTGLPASQPANKVAALVALGACVVLLIVLAVIHLRMDVWPFDSAEALVSKLESQLLRPGRAMDTDVCADGLDMLYSKTLAEDDDATDSLGRILTCADSVLMRVALDGSSMRASERDRMTTSAFSVCSGVCGGNAMRSRMQLVPAGMLDRMTRVFGAVMHHREAVQYGAMSIGALVDALQQHAVQSHSSESLRSADAIVALTTVIQAWKVHAADGDDSKEACLWCLWAVLHLVSLDELLYAEEEDENRTLSALAMQEGAFDVLLHALRQYISDDKVCTVGVLLAALLAKQAPSIAATHLSVPACGDTLQLVINTHPRVERVQQVGGMLLAAFSRLQGSTASVRRSAEDSEVD